MVYPVVWFPVYRNHWQTRFFFSHCNHVQVRLVISLFVWVSVSVSVSQLTTFSSITVNQAILGVVFLLFNCISALDRCFLLGRPGVDLGFIKGGANLYDCGGSPGNASHCFFPLTMIISDGNCLQAVQICLAW